MKKNMFIFICIFLIIIMIIVLIVKNNSKNNESKGLNIVNSKNESIENNIKEEYIKETKSNTELKEIKRIGNLEIGNVKISNSNGVSILTANVTNKGISTINLTLLEITLYDRNQKELTKLKGLVESLKPSESTQLNIGVTADYTNAYDYEIIIK